MPGVRRGRLTVVVLALAGAVLAGCSGGEAPRGTVNVNMYDNFFAREVTRVPAGTTVRFPNKGRTPHNAVAVDGTWRTPARIAADDAATVVLDQPGVYRFYCSFHAAKDGRQGMAATMVVGEAEATLSLQGVAFVTHIERGTPGEAVARVVERTKCDALFAGAHVAQGGSQVTVSHAEEILRHTDIPVVIQP